MKPRRRPRTTVRLLLLSALLAASAPAVSHAALTDNSATVAKTPDPLDQISHIPESNPYRAALVELLSLPPADRDAIKAWTDHDAEDAQTARPVLTPEQTALAASLAQAVAQASSAVSTTADDWPLQIDPDDPTGPAALMSTEVGPMRQLARITTQVAASAPPAEAIPLYAATARLGREARQGPTLLKLLMGGAIESIALTGAAKRLNEFSPAELEALSAAWADLPPPATIHHALQSEHDAYFDPICQNILLPGIKAHFAAEENPALSQNDTPQNLDHLRLSALVDFGDGEKRITLENLATGEFFTVSQGRPAEGVELLEFDIPGHRAHIRVQGRDAVINLQTKEVVAKAIDHAAALRKFRELLDQIEFPKSDDDPDGELARQAWFSRIKNHPGGPDGYFAMLRQRWALVLTEEVASAQHPTAPDGSPPSQNGDAFADPLLASIAPTVGKIARALQTSNTATIMLQAAIRHRLGQPAQAPADPWSASSTDDSPAAPFTFEPTPDGGFTLASRYERNRDEPVTYKFAAPNAGIIRKK